MRLIIVCCVAASLWLAGCSSQPEAIMAPPPQVQEFSFEPYRMGVGDTLRIDVWRNEQLSVSVPVRPDGMISMPLIGDVLAASQTTSSLSSTISNLLEDYVRNPQVTVIVTNPESADFLNRVRIVGAVLRPLSIAHRKGMTVLDLVLLAGGVNDFALANKAVLYRTIKGEPHQYPVQLGDILERGDLQTNYTLAPSDIVTVPERSY